MESTQTASADLRHPSLRFGLVGKLTNPRSVSPHFAAETCRERCRSGRGKSGCGGPCGTAVRLGAAGRGHEPSASRLAFLNRRIARKTGNAVNATSCAGAGLVPARPEHSTKYPRGLAALRARLLASPSIKSTNARAFIRLEDLPAGLDACAAARSNPKAAVRDAQRFPAKSSWRNG